MATMPLYAYQQVWNLTEEALLRSICLSYLVCMYIKEYSGKLSAFCGCAIAAGTGAACGLVYPVSYTHLFFRQMVPRQRYSKGNCCRFSYT